MRNTQRILALGAMTLTAGAVFGMTATAASAAATTQDGKTTVAQNNPKPDPKGSPKGDPKGNGKGDPKWHGGNDGKWDGRGGKNHDRSWIAGYYKNKKSCEIHNWWGEHTGQYDWGVCVPAFNPKKGWLLVAHDNGHRGHR
ncbi:hypothetical protein [Dactylosporangium sp. CA-139066]|uniref:hypothetical protein n=1 Tax=Dactylosporangium sp. CA-139066 TaxID=3239930 RepID=UPI003D8B078C